MTSPIMFKNIEDAGRQLSDKLKQYRGTDTVVLALPRGGVVVGHEISQALDLPLDIVVTRKIGHPSNPEYAICAVDEKGTLLCDEAERKMISESWLKEEVERQKKEAKRRLHLYRGNKKPIKIKGKNVILTDDGVATGLTMQLAILAIKAQKPQRVIVAVPVAPSEVVGDLKKKTDELIVLMPPKEFAGAVGAHFQEFGQIEDEEVVQLLG